MSNILITGGAGFIGYHLSLFHIKKGDNVYILDNLSKTNDKEFSLLKKNKNVHFFKCDLTVNQDKLKSKLPKKIDIIYHLAAINGTRLFYEIPYELCKSNLLITINFLNLISDIKISNFLYSSSSEIYANSEKLGLVKYPTNEKVVSAYSFPLDPRLSYGISKFTGEFLSIFFCKKYKINHSIVRYHNIFGERMGYRHVIPELIYKLSKNKRNLKLYGSKETRSFCYIDDAIKATYLVAKKSSKKGNLINIGNSSNEISIRNLANKIIEYMGLKTKIKQSGKRSLSVNKRKPSTAKLFNLTGFRSSVSLDIGLKKTINWYQKDLFDKK